MATIQSILYTCDNCDTALGEGIEAIHFRITYNDVTTRVDLCADCSEKVAWLHAKGERIIKRGRPAGVKNDPDAPKRPRGRPRKPAVGTGTDTGPIPDAAVVVDGGKVMTLGELIGDESTTVASTDLSDDGMGGSPVLAAVPTHPAFVTPAGP